VGTGFCFAVHRSPAEGKAQGGDQQQPFECTYTRTISIGSASAGKVDANPLGSANRGEVGAASTSQ
jgi:hypothetical protein